MKKIFISSTGVRSGQSLAAWGIGEILKSQGLKIGFFKPFITRPLRQNGRTIDKDALLMKEYFNLTEDLEVICPVLPEDIPADEVAREEQLMLIEEGYEKVKSGKDALIIMGSEKIFYEPDAPHLPDGSLVSRFDSPVLLVDKFQSESMSIYSVLAIDSPSGLHSSATPSTGTRVEARVSSTITPAFASTSASPIISIRFGSEGALLEHGVKE